MRTLSEATTAELASLSPEKREVVLKGLRAKLGFHKKTGILSYRYDVCPVCQDMGSTEQNPKCEKCYIRAACKEPFTKGFRDDVAQGVEYFTAMREFLERIPA